MQDLPIACSLSETDLRDRQQGLLAQLVASAASCRFLEDGASFTFSSSDVVLSLLVQVVAAERRCCRFLRFQLTLEPDLGPMVLDITGPAGTREFLHEVLPA